MTNIDGRVIRCVDIKSASFVNSFGAIKDKRIRSEIAETIKGLLFAEVDSLPRKLHFHQLTGKQVQSVLSPTKKVNAWSLHVTSDDTYKASFTYEDGGLYFRLVDLHDTIDKRP